MQFQIKPNWQPIETAPKTRPIWLAAKSVDFHTGIGRWQFGECYWGVMPAYPDHEPEWLPVGQGDNACWNNDEPFVHERFNKGTPNEHSLYRGFQTTHWAEIIRHSVLTSYPSDYVFHTERKAFFQIKDKTI